MTLPSLLSRVEAATGSDRELDAELWFAFTPGATRKQWSYTHKATGRLCEVDETRENGRLIIVPEYTSSLDAALGLVERLLPRWYVRIERYSDGWYVYLGQKSTEKLFEHSQAPNAALGMLGALLQALIEKGTTDD